MNFWGSLIAACLAVEFIPLFAGLFADLIPLRLSQWDQDSVFVWLTVHHIFQLGLTILVMVMICRGLLSQWGFNLNKAGTSLRIIAVFTVVFSLIEFIYMSGQVYSTDFPGFNKLGWQGFQYFLSGTGEEPLFRGLVIVLLLKGMTSSNISVSHQYVIAVAVSTMLFMYAHLEIDWLSLSAPGYDFEQQTKALQLGILFGVVFIHTRSLFAPIVLHGLSNGITATIGFYIV